MGKPRYMFKPCEGPDGELVIYMEMIPEPPPTPEKFQRKARLRRLKQTWRDTDEAIAQVEADYKAKP